MFTCPSGANICILYPMGNGNPAFNLAPGQSANSLLISRAIIYPVTTTTTTTSGD